MFLSAAFKYNYKLSYQFVGELERALGQIESGAADILESLH